METISDKLLEHDVFISYSHIDRDLAEAICHILEQHQIRCWMAPKSIPAGSDYGDLIDTAIDSCKIFLIIFSAASTSSPWVRGELNLAFSLGRSIIPFRIDQTPLKGAMRLILNQTHWIDASTSPEKQFEKLLASIVSHVNKPNIDKYTEPPVTTKSKGIKEILMEQSAPKPDKGKPFLMAIEDVFSITNRETVVTGCIETGIIRVGDEIEIVGSGIGSKGKRVVCVGVEMSRKLYEEGYAGDNVGLFLRGIAEDEVKRGMVLSQPGVIREYSKFIAEIYLLTTAEGGRKKPIPNGFSAIFYIRTMDCPGTIHLLTQDCCYPGDCLNIEVELPIPVALNIDLLFAIREKNKTIGAGKIIQMIQ